MYTEDSPAVEKAQIQTGCAPWLFLFFLWIVGAVRLFYELLTIGIPRRTFADTTWTLAITLVLAALLWLLYSQARTVRQRALYLTWLSMLSLPLLMIPTTWLMPVHSQWAAFVRVGLLLLYAIGVRWMVGPLPVRTLRPAAGLVALAAAALLAYPWLVWGALGSLTDSVLALLAGLLFGWSVAQLLARFWLRSLAVAAATPGRDLFIGGLVIGVALLLVVHNVGFNNGTLLLALGLPALGWLLMVISVTGLPDHRQAAQNWPALAIVLGLGAAYPLLLADPDTLPLIFLFQQEGLVWALLATLVMVAIALIVALFLWLLRPNSMGGPAHPALQVGAAGLWAAGLALYFVVGQPGFYGDHIFVFLVDRADVSAAAAIDDYDERRRTVYQNLVAHADESQADLRHSLERFAIGYTPYYLVNGLEVEGNVLVQLWLAQHPAVDRIIPAPILRPLPRQLAEMIEAEERPPSPPWNLELINAPQVWAELDVRGAGIVIGHSDSGVQWDHHALRHGYRGAAGEHVEHDYNWFDPWEQSAFPVDPGGHGTYTLGSVMGDRIGVAPEAEWFACRNLARNLGNTPLYLDCLQFMLAPFPLGGDPFIDGDPTRSAHVTNNSWGCPQEMEGCDPHSLRPAVEALRAAGIFTVAAAGNEGPECGSVESPPAIYAAVLSVGAIDWNRDLAAFSSVGPVTVDGSARTKPDLLAPGVDVLSAAPNDGYMISSGTSAAGPHVAGVVALMWSANPALIGDIERTEQILLETAIPFTGTLAEDLLPLAEPCPLNLETIPNNAAGYGIVDAYAAVQRALEIAE
jgi:hypothetical protein